MELTEENAQAGDKAYLDLVLLQTLGSDRDNLIWCSIWGILIQGYLLGLTVSRIWRFVCRRKRYEMVIRGGVLGGLMLIITQLGITIDQTYRIIFAFHYTDISMNDARRNIVTIVCSGTIGCLSVGYATWMLWKMAPRISPIIPLIILNTIIIGLTVGISVISYQMPKASVSDLFLVKEWLGKFGILLRVWLGIELVLHVGIWMIMVWQIRSKKEFEKGEKLRTVCQALWSPTLAIVVLLVYSLVEIPSLVNASRPLVQSFSALFFLTFMYLLDLSHFTSSLDGEIALPESSSVYYKSPPISRRGLLPDSYSGYTTTTSTSSGSGSGSGGHRSTKSSKSKAGMGSVRISIDQLVTESKTISPPPSAYKFKDKQPQHRSESHQRYPSLTPVQSPIPTPIYSNSVYSDVPLSIIAPFSEWLEYNSPHHHSQAHDGDEEGIHGADADDMSYKSAVPSGKTLLRTKSERSKKDRGIVLDHTGWEVPLPQAQPQLLSQRTSRSQRVSQGPPKDHDVNKI
ncbi:hypothetical protein I203_107032 [Kwoniella mangroviensis CBS 8507]|uniref:hypothetical protein n=1 Tax=Kwoniella mangroviensis CBS 8507 TaxID=1296122 RepID=UPI00080CCD58|nr:uncharacterized protein I203_01779 [Kwoniella mangroviensis CBS 8507]OCF68398.1 hypothetical protein I203_01779 [Kwoniella mangroviensis CBS 8507]